MPIFLFTSLSVPVHLKIHPFHPVSILHIGGLLQDLFVIFDLVVTFFDGLLKFSHLPRNLSFRSLHGEPIAKYLVAKWPGPKLYIQTFQSSFTLLVGSRLEPPLLLGEIMDIMVTSEIKTLYPTETISTASRIFIYTVILYISIQYILFRQLEH